MSTASTIKGLYSETLQYFIKNISHFHMGTIYTRFWPKNEKLKIDQRVDDSLT